MHGLSRLEQGKARGQQGGAQALPVMVTMDEPVVQGSRGGVTAQFQSAAANDQPIMLQHEK